MYIAFGTVYYTHWPFIRWKFKTTEIFWCKILAHFVNEQGIWMYMLEQCIGIIRCLVGRGIVTLQFALEMDQIRVYTCTCIWEWVPFAIFVVFEVWLYDKLASQTVMCLLRVSVANTPGINKPVCVCGILDMAVRVDFQPGLPSVSDDILPLLKCFVSSEADGQHSLPSSSDHQKCLYPNKPSLTCVCLSACWESSAKKLSIFFGVFFSHMDRSDVPHLRLLAPFL